MRRPCARWIVTALLAGCSARALDVPGAAVDAAVASCGPLHHYAAVPIASVRQLDGSMTLTRGAALRLQISIAARSCDVPSEIDVTVRAGDPEVPTVVAITAHAWISSADCGASTLVSRVYTIDAAQITSDAVDVNDASAPSSNTTLLALGAMTTKPPACSSRMLGESCDADCDCTASPAALCLLTKDGQHVCGVPCTNDVECSGVGPGAQCDLEGRFACDAMPPMCRDASECEFSQSVAHCACEADLPYHQPPCNCDSECPAGLVCDADLMMCVQPCVTAVSCDENCTATGCVSTCSNGACPAPSL